MPTFSFADTAGFYFLISLSHDGDPQKSQSRFPINLDSSDLNVKEEGIWEEDHLFDPLNWQKLSTDQNKAFEPPTASVEQLSGQQ